MANLDSLNSSPAGLRSRPIAMSRFFIASSALVLLTSANSQVFLTGRPSEGPLAEAYVGVEFVQLMDHGRFAEAGPLLKSTFQSRERFIDGQWIASILLDRYAKYLQRTTAWSAQSAVIQSWRRADPKNGEAAIVEATYWLSYAWYARGVGPLRDMPRLALQRAKERTAKARAVLEAAKPYAANYPAWYACMLDVALLQGWPLSKRFVLFDEAVKAEPYYYPTYFRMATSLMPRWGGTLTDYDRFVEASAIKTKPIEGNSMYARLYWFLSENSDCCKDTFLSLEIPWPEMKSGFEDILQRYPRSQWNQHHYAYFACRVADGKTFLRLLPTLKWTPEIESYGVWRGAYTFDYCKSQFTSRS